MLWNWFGLARPSDRKRGIFPYRDGSRTRRADPVEVETKLIRALGSDWRAVVRRLDRPAFLSGGLMGEQLAAAEREWLDGRDKVLAAVDAAFGVHGLNDDGGLTDVERFGLLNGFCLFCADLIEGARPFADGRSRASPSPAAPPAPSRPASTSPAT